jgi:two-component system sensor histidine kinase SenX3
VSDEISFADLLASSIHDMKNALNLHVRVLEQVALRCKAQGDQAGFDDLGALVFESNRMNMQLVEMLSLYKLGKSIYPIDIEEHIVADVIHEVVLQSQFVLAHKGIRLTVDCADGCYWFFDKELLKGVLVNALNNACAFARDHITIVARLTNKSLELRVEDNGPGYPQSMLTGSVAESKAVNFSTGSTGLGLYFCEQVAQLHKNGGKRGNLHIENGGSLGGGCFVMTLP